MSPSVYNHVVNHKHSNDIFIIKGFRIIVFIIIVKRPSEGSSTRWDWKVGYGGPNMEEKGKPLWDEAEIIDRAEHCRIRRLKESAHMLGYSDLLSRPSIEMNTIWEPIIKKVR